MSGNFGYIKTKKVTEKENKRTSMEDGDFTSNISDISSAVEIKKNVLSIENLNDFTKRKETVSKIVSDIISKGKFTINLNLENVDIPIEKLERFVIELIPRLKEIGGSVVVTNNNILGSEFLVQNRL